MADWNGHARSNYFRVKDRQKFEEWAASIGDLKVIDDGKGRVGLLSTDEFGAWPYSRHNDDTAEDEKIDLIRELAAHLQDGSVAVFMEVGAEVSIFEKAQRFLKGHAEAVNSKGEQVMVNINDIYDLAKTLGDEVTAAEY